MAGVARVTGVTGVARGGPDLHPVLTGRRLGAVRALVTESGEFGRAVDGLAVQRIIVVPGQIVNVVARSIQT